MYHKWQSYDVWFLRYGVQQTEFFVILDHFLPFYPLTTPKIKILKNWKKHLNMLSFYTSAPQMTIIWCMVPEICDGQNFLSFWTVFCPSTPLTTWKIKIFKNWKKKNKKKTHRDIIILHMCTINDVWFLRYWAQQTGFFVILDHFLPFYPPNNSKYQNFEKILKTLGDIILHMCTKNHDDMPCCS